MEQANKILEQVKTDPQTAETRIEYAIELAALLAAEAARQETRKERRRYIELGKMLDDQKGKVFTTQLTDQCFRSKNDARTADQMRYLIQAYGVPSYLSWFKRKEISAFRWAGKALPSLLVPMMRREVQNQTREVIIQAKGKELVNYLRKQQKRGVCFNLNHIGEAILSEEEAKRRLQVYVDDLGQKEIEYVSIKISTICSQLNLVAWDKTLEILKERLRTLYRAGRGKFINLDMEEYRDLQLTVELFCSVLEEPEFFEYSAGIALQSYIPDSYPIQQRLTLWAMERVAKGGAPIKIRLVKGANLAMEQVDSSFHGWPQPPYSNKRDVDANFKRMVQYGLTKEHAAAAHVGIGSHNLFDIAYALILRAENGVEEQVTFEMLEGMANHMQRVVQKVSGGMVVYCPVTTYDDFENAVSYLMRRLDENAAPQNFLRHMFEMSPGDAEWNEQQQAFIAACNNASTAPTGSRRTQNRLLEPQRPLPSPTFVNEPNTDFSIRENRKWAHSILAKGFEKKYETIPLVIAGESIFSKEHEVIGRDPSRPGHELYRYTEATEEDIDRALSCAVEEAQRWGRTSPYERAELLEEIYHSIRRNRGLLIETMIASGGKTVEQADVEVSEAVDFVDYYRRSLLEWTALEDIAWKPQGVVLVAPPWNFPAAIPCGGVIAALAAGNSVIFKPAPEAHLVGATLAQIIWNAGVSQKTLQLIACEEEPVGSKLIQDKRVNLVVLTGATSTARNFLKMRPSLNLMAETGGKNSIIVTAMADRDMAIRDIISSAFYHAGQKCSACSLAILEAEVYDSPKFRRQLKEAAASFYVGSAWDPATIVNPLVRAPGKRLMRGLTQLDEGEEWLLEPKQDPENPQLWSPGIKLGVIKGSFTHQTELFGPVLGLMRADSLGDAIELANGTPYGLTSGIHTLDDREKKLWLDKIVAGNCYVNRTITGAIVQRQPFGGCKASSFGRGAKAGGPNYLTQMMQPTQIGDPKERGQPPKSVLSLCQHGSSRYRTSLESYSYWWEHHFSKKHDPSLLIGQDNLFSYQSRGTMLFRIQDQDAIEDILRVIAAATICGTTLVLSSSKQLMISGVIEEDESALIAKLKEAPYRRVRTISAPSTKLLKALHDHNMQVDYAPVLSNGRLELLHYLREVSVSDNYHRYGNLGVREDEERTPLPTPTQQERVRWS